ncbi:hypothetical protein GCM10011578_059910 [Streptomyces fuscichromogenes]|uniref:Uncharacterized protein n=1 Tax=Streptomyces fuscichromogenes TaxID=1324013 RepID=A0A917XH68_9ACTN|nr:hypothetical protein GCM10011578_059910 [Streptomyces fuscichromogenes]
MQVTDRYGTAKVMAWDRIHPRLTTRSAWIDHDRPGHPAVGSAVPGL